MKNKIKLFSLISALAIGATMSFTACSKDNVGEHDHVWNDGTVTTESTCYSEGVKTYACTVDGCGQTKTEPVAMIAHSWDNGDLTKQATCREEGVMTYTCTVEGCGKTKEESVEKTAHRYDDGKITLAPDFLIKGIKTITCLDCGTEKTESIEAHADFFEQYYTTLTEQTDWLYGYASSYDAGTGEVEFVRSEQTEDDAWKSEKTLIGKGYVYSENNAVVAYGFNQAIPKEVQTKVAISFSGEESGTRLNAYLIIKSNDGALKSSVELNKDNGKDWSYKPEKALDIAQGDIFYLVFNNNGEGKAGGNLSFTLTAPCLHVWDSGNVTKESTCTVEGVKTYSCLSCDNTYDEAVATIPHKYDVGVVTVEPTETSTGVRIYTCESCGDKKTEVIPQLASTVFNGADFTADFSMQLQSDWKYGYATNYDFAGNTFTFNDLKPNASTGAWVDDNGGIEIKSDWIKNESSTGTNATIIYRMPQTREIDIALTFRGSDGNTVTRITARLIIQKADGTVQSCDFIDDGQTSSAWTYSKTATVEAGGTVSVVFFNEGSAGWFHGNFSMKLNIAGQEQPTPETYAVTFEMQGHGTAPEAQTIEDGKYALKPADPAAEGWVFGGWYKEAECENEFNFATEKITSATRVYAKWTENTTPPAPEVNVADFKEDFTLENQNGAWSYGKTEDPWNENNDRHFVASTTKTDDAWTADGVEIKAGWINAASTSTIAYTAENAMTAKVKVQFEGSEVNTLLGIRIFAVNANGEWVEKAFNNTKNDDGKQVVTIDYEFKANETIYIMFSNEHWNGEEWQNAAANGNLDITITVADNGECIHSWDEGEVTEEPTCSSDGVKSYTCSNCKETKTEAITERPEHDFSGDWVNTSADGHYKECKNCGAVSESIEHNHNKENEEKRIAATCNSDGTKYMVCECGNEITEAITERPEHDFTGDWINTSADGHYKQCAVCNENQAPVEHTMLDDGEITPPTNDEPGVMKTKCSVCGYESTREITALNHKQSAEYGKDDNNHWFKCSEHADCGVKFVEEQHDYTEELQSEGKPATCGEDGYSVWKCDCGATEQRTISKDTIPHTFGDSYVSEGDDGHYQVCSVCQSNSESEAHNMVIKSITNPTFHANGSEESECDKCGKSVTKELPACVNFKYDFSTEENPNGAWSYGYVNYSWTGGESFEFHKAETFEGGAWKVYDGEGENRKEIVQIKSDWIDASANTTIAYTFTEKIAVKLTLKFIGGMPNTRVITRIGVKDKDGTLTGVPEGFWDGNNTNSWQVNKDYNFNEGDTIYIMFFNEGNSETNKDLVDAFPNGMIDITFTVKEEQGDPEFSGANLKNDFTLDNQDGAWSYGYVNFHFRDVNDPEDKEDFEFVAATEKGDYGWIAVVGEGDNKTVDVDVRGDYMEVRKGFAAIAYMFTASAKVKVSFKFTGNGTGEDQGSITSV